MTNVFVSYSRHDKERVAPLVAFIDSLIGEVWWDDRFVAGESFTEETERRLDEADFVVVVWTPNSAHSKWVLDEAAVGRDAGKLIPISLDGALPPLGFRHVHTLDFAGWNGTDTDKCALALKAALLRTRTDKRAEASASPVYGGSVSGEAADRGGALHPRDPDLRRPPLPSASPTPPLLREGGMGHAHRLRSTIIIGLLAVFGIAIIGGLTIGALTVLGDREPANRSIADVTSDLIAGRDSGDPAVKQAEKAVAEIGGSARAEERAAFSSFAAGDQTHALDILEKLAADLERAGDKKAAAEAYTRVGAIALLIDQGRGLAARRKAFALAPESLLAFQGLFFDIFRLRGYDASAAYAGEVIANPATADRMRGFAYAHLAIAALGDVPNLEVARTNLARVEALRDRTDDRHLDATAVWVASILNWRQDRLTEAAKSTAAFEKMAVALREPVFILGSEVAFMRQHFAAGDWNAVFLRGTRMLEARQNAGQFLPAPMLNLACRAGLYSDRAEAAAPYCEAFAGGSDHTGGAQLRIYSAELAAARGDFDKARAELDASRALSEGDWALQSERLRVDAMIAANEGDLDEAEKLVWRYADLVAADPASRSLRATMLRLFGIWAIKAGAPDRACGPLRESGALYAAVGGKEGSDATKSLRAEAGCR